MSAVDGFPSQRRPLTETGMFEPSMEEILASIRRIITDDQAESAERAETAEAAETEGAKDADRSAGGQGFWGPAANPPVAEDAANARPLRPAGNGASGSFGPASPSAPALVSPAADASVAAAFNVLVASRFAQNSDAIAALTAEALRPLLRGWLDEHLPPLVERLVKAEIERIARGG